MKYPHHFQKVILHFDGDSFFASVEQVMNYKLRGKALVTGRERGVITSASLEAKKLGIKRGISFRDARILCPDLIVVPGDYLSYSIFAHRMYNIVREFTSHVEEYSIDECFADITGLDKVYKKSYEEIALMIKAKLETSLGVTFGVGLAPNKVLAKVASKHRKPGGFTDITRDNLEEIMRDLPAGKIWGIGPAMSVNLSRMGVETALEFASKSTDWLTVHKISKPYREIWLELNGYSVMELGLEAALPKSIITSRSFTPSVERNYIYAQLVKNVEAACNKLRRQKLRSKQFSFYLKTQQFTYQEYNVSLSLASSSPTEIMRWISLFFDQVYRRRVLYRATGICLREFGRGESTPDLFGGSVDIDKQAEVFKAVDKIAKRYGEETIYLGSSHLVRSHEYAEPSKVIDIPFLGLVK